MRRSRTQRSMRRTDTESASALVSNRSRSGLPPRVPRAGPPLARSTARFGGALTHSYRASASQSAANKFPHGRTKSSRVSAPTHMHQSVRARESSPSDPSDDRDNPRIGGGRDRDGRTYIRVGCGGGRRCEVAARCVSRLSPNSSRLMREPTIANLPPRSRRRQHSDKNRL